MSINSARLAIVLVFAVVTKAPAQYIERSPSPQTIARTAAQFKNIYSQSGINGFSIAIQRCYDTNRKNNRELLNCMLLDVSAIKLDRGMREQFISRGMNDIVTSPYFSDAAISARLNIYTSLLFNGNTNAATSYLSDAANKVIDLASPQ